MRKLLQILIVAAILSIPTMFGGVATAASTCPVGYTGPDSTNICKSTKTYKCTVGDNNMVTITGQNAQGSLSGNATNGDNTSGGDSQTGTATNSNGASFSFTVTNDEQCSAVETVKATPTPTPTPTPGTTNTTVKPVTPTKQSAPTALANTAGSDVIGWAIAAAAVVAAAAIATRFGVTAYKRR